MSKLERFVVFDFDFIRCDMNIGLQFKVSSVDVGQLMMYFLMQCSIAQSHDIEVCECNELSGTRPVLVRYSRLLL